MPGRMRLCPIHVRRRLGRYIFRYSLQHHHHEPAEDGSLRFTG
jgi:hypothetical protein